MAGRSVPAPGDDVHLADAPVDGPTFARLLDINAAALGDRPAWRHKDRGVWQTWTWAQTRTEVRAMASGFAALGVQRGDCISIIGSNRPRLYWAVMAAHAIGAVPAPVYADAVAEELAFVCAHAKARFAVVQDQEQVDKLMSIAEQLPDLQGIIYDEPRGLRDYDHGGFSSGANAVRVMQTPRFRRTGTNPHSASRDIALAGCTILIRSSPRAQSAWPMRARPGSTAKSRLVAPTIFPSSSTPPAPRAAPRG